MPNPAIPGLHGEMFWRGEPGYETYRRGAVWRANTPPRFPQLIVMAHDDSDVVAAVRFARKEGLKVGTRSGGHSWTSPHIRDGALLIDLSRMQDVRVDAGRRQAWVKPAVKGSRLNLELQSYGLIFPTGHHNNVGLGGFLLAGGFGWNARAWGNGCTNVRAVDVVTAEGELIRADETQNSDYLWAARGAGPGFFGVVTAFELNLHPLPRAMRHSAYVYPLETVGQVTQWARDLVPEVPRFVELIIAADAVSEDGGWTPKRGFAVSGLATCDDDVQAIAALKLLDTCPVVDKAVKRRIAFATNLNERYAGATRADPEGMRYSADNIYTNASGTEVGALMPEFFGSIPTPRSHIFWLNWGPLEKLPDMAFSVAGEVYIAAYALWSDPADDARIARWPTEQMKRLAPISVGGQMNDEGMIWRKERYLSPSAANRLEAMRKKYDPGGMFVSYLTG